MKLPLPYSKKEFEKLKIIKSVEVSRFNKIHPENHQARLDQSEYIRGIVDKMYEYTNIDLYNKLARNRCKFSNSDDAEDVCEGKFKNTLANYSSNGNCCKSCNALFINKIKNSYSQYEVQN